MKLVNIYEDAGKSGKTIEGRPAFKKLLIDIENGLVIDYVVESIFDSATPEEQKTLLMLLIK